MKQASLSKNSESPRRVLVTGAAGFVGSHLVERLLADGHQVVGLDAFLPYYPRPLKEANLTAARANPRFTFHECDLRDAHLEPLLANCEVIFHLAAMPGLMLSWQDVPLYASCNILGTQRLLEAARHSDIQHLIHVSTSSAYGVEACGTEEAPTRPISPYGITKLAAEHLCQAYAHNFGLPYTILRYFSVYGPRQRPDMAYNILIRTLLAGQVFSLYGDGAQSRGNTYVADAVDATVSAMERRAACLGEIINIGGGQVVTLRETIALLEELTGRTARIEYHPPRPGDQRHTAADISKAARLLDYHPATTVRAGLAAQVQWQTGSSHSGGVATGAER
ncbi:MAG: NAD-dependent epimerase/dehydratase family protein [Candidatus Marinimicrobia bacterium]|nr:NAD-dependent epimerase/dehydratase family protein [Candidatus Neomarinimicrobiota bacterium]